MIITLSLQAFQRNTDPERAMVVSDEENDVPPSYGSVKMENAYVNNVDTTLGEKETTLGEKETTMEEKETRLDAGDNETK